MKMSAQATTLMGRAFLTARWANLVLMTYAVEEKLLVTRVPAGCVLDRWEGKPCVSLVAFDFLETRVLGVGWPGFRNFPEINLRFYVRHGGPEGQRGVAFVREWVPSRVVAGLAKGIYNEPYRAARMRSETRVDGEELVVRHSLWVGGEEQWLQVQAAREVTTPAPGEASMEHFFKEHSWGFGMTRRGGLLTYRVEHPVWEVHAVRSWKLEWDWAAVYGEEWGVLQGAEPLSVVLAAGSAVRVGPKRL